MTTVKEIMKHHSFTLSPFDTVMFAAEYMKDHEVGLLVVAEEGEIIGIITDRDIVIRCIAKHKDPHVTKVKEIMTLPVIHCMEDDRLDSLIKKLKDVRVQRLPVLNHKMELIGIVSLKNLCAADFEKGGEVVSKMRSI